VKRLSNPGFRATCKFNVIPAKARTQGKRRNPAILGSRFRGNDDQWGHFNLPGFALNENLGVLVVHSKDVAAHDL
jgi:hypothetical protein